MTTRDVDPTLQALSRRTLPDAAELGLQMAERITAAIPAYQGEHIDFEDVVSSCTDNVRYILGILAGQPSIDRDAPRATGLRRAEQGMAYSDVLEAFRVGGRFLWERLVDRADDDSRDNLLRAAADIWAVVDELSSTVTDAYRSTLVDRARRSEQLRGVMVGALLDGETTGAEKDWRAATVLGLPQDGGFVVVSAECTSPGSEALPDVERILRRQNLAGAWRLDHDRHEGLVVLPLGFDVARLVEALAELSTARVGISAVFHRIDASHDARQEARLALAAATPGSAEVIRFEEHPLAVLVAASSDAATSLVRRALGPVLVLPADEAAIILETARTWLAAGGSTSAAAKTLHLHRNTVRYRLRRLEELVGCDLTHPVDAARIHVALEGARILGLG
ncbi:PucR family transcriptional regulator [Nocardioides cavernaquae]|uniref:PucR family transcriptional regulator n=1 Tax=Nocardioides cavernaquae TaxID=2321396 RepID=UPI0011C45486|nr:PucR family transcriptional regulator [Nocardioides cavernaquae]